MMDVAVVEREHAGNEGSYPDAVKMHQSQTSSRAHEGEIQAPEIVDPWRVRLSLSGQFWR